MKTIIIDNERFTKLERNLSQGFKITTRINENGEEEKCITTQPSNFIKDDYVYDNIEGFIFEIYINDEAKTIHIEFMGFGEDDYEMEDLEDDINVVKRSYSDYDISMESDNDDIFDAFEFLHDGFIKGV